MCQDINLDREVIFFRYCNGTATAEEKRQVEQWIKTSSRAAGELEAVKEAYFFNEQLRELEEVNVVKGYEQVRSKIKSSDKKRSLIKSLYRGAAIFSLPLLCSTLFLIFLYIHTFGKDTNPYLEISAAPGFISKFELPDQSLVWLNEDSKLRYPVRFTGKTREVELTGEGYFEVNASEKYPFIVTTPSGIKIMAQGTRFNINASESVCEVVLAEGKLKIVPDSHTIKQLMPGEQALINSSDNFFAVNRIDVYEKIAWKDGKVIYRDIPLPELFEKLGQRYNVEIIFHDKYNQADNYHTHLTFTNESIYQILTYLEAAAPIRWKAETPVSDNSSMLSKQRIQIWLKKLNP